MQAILCSCKVYAKCRNQTTRAESPIRLSGAEIKTKAHIATRTPSTLCPQICVHVQHRFCRNFSPIHCVSSPPLTWNVDARVALLAHSSTITAEDSGVPKETTKDSRALSHSLLPRIIGIS